VKEREYREGEGVAGGEHGLIKKRWQDAAASKLREAQDLRVYTAITLMENFTAALHVLFDEILILREEAIVFPTGAPPRLAYHKQPYHSPVAHRASLSLQIRVWGIGYLSATKITVSTRTCIPSPPPSPLTHTCRLDIALRQDELQAGESEFGQRAHESPTSF